MASVPVASIWWIGLKRPPNRPVCGPVLSSGMPSANTLPVRIRLAALTMSSGVTWLSVPIWSSLPQRPQLDSVFEASAIAPLPTLMFMPPVPFSVSLARLIKRQSDLAQRPQNLVRRKRHVGERLRLKRPQRVVDRVHHAGRRARSAGLARALGAEL